MTASLAVTPIAGVGEVGDGDRIGELIVAAAGRGGREVSSDDVVVVSQKVVSKAEGRVRDLAKVAVSGRARELASELDKDPRVVELVLAEARRVVRAERGVLIVETGSGLVCANAGIDGSNVPGVDRVTLLPLDADASARRIRAEIRERGGTSPAIVVADSFGRAWRLGQTDVAIGCAGLAVIDDWRGRRDRGDRELTATAIAVADEVAAAADLARDKASGTPAVVVRGLARFVTADDGPGAAALRRAEADDLFR
jgi:coenzyme F420-0:L-glutamate ligase / coenzyme F420-1:gamma-L-glutamate ligase